MSKVEFCMLRCLWNVILLSQDQALTAQPLCVPAKKGERQVDGEQQPFEYHSGTNCRDFQNQHDPCARYDEVIIWVGGDHTPAVDQHLDQ